MPHFHIAIHAFISIYTGNVKLREYKPSWGELQREYIDGSKYYNT